MTRDLRTTAPGDSGSVEASFPDGAGEPMGDGEDVTLDKLAGEWRIFQLRRGHRFSTDDLLCAWAAALTRPLAHRLLDLGAGIGSVGLMTLWKLPPEATMVMVEAQVPSHLLCRRTLAWNGLQDRVRALLGDLREPGVVPDEGTYDLITCSPPYIPLGKGAISPNPQRAAARLELRGTIYDYLATARRALAPEGRVAVVFAGTDPRGEDAVARAGLRLEWRRDICFRKDRPPTITLLVAGLDVEGPPDRPEPLVVRDGDGRFTGEMMDIRRAMGSALSKE